MIAQILPEREPAIRAIAIDRIAKMKKCKPGATKGN
jgi:hypothetical protein